MFWKVCHFIFLWTDERVCIISSDNSNNVLGSRLIMSSEWKRVLRLRVIDIFLSGDVFGRLTWKNSDQNVVSETFLRNDRISRKWFTKTWPISKLTEWGTWSCSTISTNLSQHFNPCRSTNWKILRVLKIYQYKYYLSEIRRQLSCYKFLPLFKSTRIL